MTSHQLSAVAILSEPADYDGGTLRLRPVPGVREFDVPRDRGVVVVSQPWVLHEVTPVTRGLRQTVNLGAWGRPLR